MERPKIKIKFVDFGGTEEFYQPYFCNLIGSFAQVEISDHPDYIFYSTYGYEHLNYDCIKIYYASEELEPDFNVCDYAIGYTDISFYDRYLHLPLFAYPASVEKTKKALYRNFDDQKVNQNRDKFCNFIYSNGKGDPFRAEVFHALSKYKHVDSAGRYLNNMGNIDIAGSRYATNYEESKIKFLESYKFTIAMSNAQKFGYLDEKIFDAWLAGSVPIYWGDPKISEFFNPESFIDCTMCKTPEEVVEKVKEIDSSPEKYLAMQKAPITLCPEKIEYYFNEQRIVDFLKNIFLQEYFYARRVSNGIWAKNHIKQRKLIAKIESSALSKLKKKVDYYLTRLK